MTRDAEASLLPGRPREFDVDDAVRDAMTVFWDRGYHATSLPDLLDGTGLSRGSLYKAFGHKRDLFLRALDLYAQEGLAALTRSLRTSGVKQGIRAAMQRYVLLSIGEAGRRGCLIVATASEMSAHDPEIAARLKRTFDSMQDLLAAAITSGKAAGEIRTDRNEQDLARFLVSQMQGMRVLGKSGMTRRDTEAVADIAVRCLD